MSEHSSPSTCLNLSTDEVKGRPGEGERVNRGGGGGVPVGRECPLFFPACCVSFQGETWRQKDVFPSLNSPGMWAL